MLLRCLRLSSSFSSSSFFHWDFWIANLNSQLSQLRILDLEAIFGWTHWMDVFARRRWSCARFHIRPFAGRFGHWCQVSVPKSCFFSWHIEDRRLLPYQCSVQMRSDLAHQAYYVNLDVYFIFIRHQFMGCLTNSSNRWLLDPELISWIEFHLLWSYPEQPCYVLNRYLPLGFTESVKFNFVARRHPWSLALWSLHRCKHCLRNSKCHLLFWLLSCICFCSVEKVDRLRCRSRKRCHRIVPFVFYYGIR